MAAAGLAEASVRVTEVFFSLQGETSRTGLPTVFVRLTGCPLRCGYCDSAYAFHGGERRTLGQLLEAVRAHPTRQVTVTGGEPLAQPGCLPLLGLLCDAGYDVSLETSGALDIGAVDPRVARVVDLKTPGSGECGRNRWENIALLGARDEVKFVLCDRADYEWARAQLIEHGLAGRCAVLMSPVHGRLAPLDLADWILADGLPVRFQVQLHKLLWGDVPGH